MGGGTAGRLQYRRPTEREITDRPGPHLCPCRRFAKTAEMITTRLNMAQNCLEDATSMGNTHKHHDLGDYGALLTM